jgi:TolB-like protein/class 3 adenylate cyclase
MTGERVVRRLAAILAADVAGYSRLVGRDENGTVTRLKAHRTERLEPMLARHGGRLVKLMGDGALVEFPSAVDALNAAIAFQQAVTEANRDQPEDTRIVFRIGLHLGDLIVEGEDLYGDGVNVAARLEAEAPPGGIVVSRAIREAVEGRLKAKLHALGELALKNIERPIRAFRVEWDAADWKTMEVDTPPPAIPADPTTSTLVLPDKPSIAVLPFSNMSSDPEHEYFTDGITEDIITELSRFRSLFVSARNSSFSYKNKSPDLRQVGRELGVRYVLEGSIRRASNRIRVTGQLIDTLTGNHIWAERYDRVLEDIFAVQEEVTLAIVAAIAPQIDSTERSKASRRRPDNLSAYEIALRARAHGLEAVGKADQMLLEQSILEAQEALAIDPGSVQALQALAYSYGTALLLRSAVDPEYALGQAAWATTRAIELDGTNAYSYALRSLAVLRGRQFDRYADALADVRRAHQMNPNDTYVLRVLAALEAGVGEPERGIEHALEVLRLNPRDPHIHITYNLLTWMSFGAKQYAEGVGWGSRALNNMPNMIQAHTDYVCCLVGTGEIDKARTAFGKFRKLAPPEYVRRVLEGSSTFGRPADRSRYLTFLHIAAGLEDPSAADALR